MNVDMQAYCGLDCTDCSARLAFVNNDDKLRFDTAEKWNSPQFPVKIDMLDCAGCKSNGPHFAFCSKCNIRICASEHHVETCAHCKDYGCDTLQEWLSQAGEDARKRLESIRTAL